MSKLPFLPFYPADWIVGTRVLTDEQKAILIDLLSFMWLNDANRGVLEGSWEELARTVGRDRLVFQTSVFFLEKVGAILVKRDDKIGQETHVKLISRRAVKHSKSLMLKAERNARYRESSDAKKDAKKDASEPPYISDVILHIADKDKDVIAPPQNGGTNPPTPPPPALTPIGKIVTVYKMASGYAKDDRAWNKLNWARCCKPAKALLDFLGSWELAADCVQDVYERLTAKNLTVTLETVVKHAADWKRDRLEVEAKRS